MPFKVFTNGAILPDTDLNDYLMEQAVISCTSGTRPGSPNDGMTLWETDTERYASWNATLGAWVPLVQMVTGTYSPALTAVTTNPTLGTAGLGEVRYTLFGGKWCTFRGTIKFGTSGTNAGSGQYLITLPFTSSNMIGNGVSTTGPGVIRCAGGSSVVTFYIAAGSSTMAAFTTGGNSVASGAPGAWTANDYLSFSMTYEIA